ncbi:MAG: MmgE/PrpD family protein [Chloroflexota bacterium]
MDSSHVLAKYIVNTTYDDLPPEVVEVTKRSILDGIGVMLAATTLGEDGVQEIVELAREAGGKQESSIIGFGYKVPACMAALANGSMTHQLDYEDTYDPRVLHPSGAILPAALAVAERLGTTTGRQFISAFALACDVMCRMSLPATRGVFEYNFFQPPVFGKYGAVSAAGKLLGLNENQMVNAFGLILHQASVSDESAYSPGSSIRAIRDGLTGHAGVLSALMAQKGIRGDQNSLEGKYGLYNICYFGDSNPALVTADLGRRFENTRVSFKPWPCCRGCQVFVDLTLRLVKEYDLSPADVTQVTVVGGKAATSLGQAIEERRAPKTSIDAKVSLPFILGAAIARRNVTLADFTAESRSDPTVLELAQKVGYRSDGRFDSPGIEGGAVEIKTTDGRLYSKETATPYGGTCSVTPGGEMVCELPASAAEPALTITRDALVAKFRDCASHSVSHFSAKKVDTLIQMLDHLEDVSDMNEVIRLLV